MATKDALKTRLARLEALRSSSDTTEVTAALRKALSDRSNIVIAKAASIAAGRYLTQLCPDLVTAYEPLFIDPVETDPLARGKEAIARALKDLDHHDPAPFLLGLEHEQLEPVYGGAADVAGGLRATCALALVVCSIDPSELLERFVDRLADSDRAVRSEVVRAVAGIGGRESGLLIRLKALAGDTDPEVYAACFDALLALEGERALPFVERFAAAQDVERAVSARKSEISFEALAALAASRLPAAFALVRRAWDEPLSRDARRNLVLTLGASPVPAASEFLIELIAEPSVEVATAALTALANSRFREDVRDRAERAAAQSASAAIRAAFAREFAP